MFLSLIDQGKGSTEKSDFKLIILTENQYVCASHDGGDENRSITLIISYLEILTSIILNPDFSVKSTRTPYNSIR